jgi:hypothetical protein
MWEDFYYFWKGFVIIVNDGFQDMWKEFVKIGRSERRSK